MSDAGIRITFCWQSATWTRKRAPRSLAQRHLFTAQLLKQGACHTISLLPGQQLLRLSNISFVLDMTWELFYSLIFKQLARHIRQFKKKHQTNKPTEQRGCSLYSFLTYYFWAHNTHCVFPVGSGISQDPPGRRIYHHFPPDDKYGREKWIGHQ